MPLATRDDRTHISQFNIKIGGAQAPRNVLNDLLDCTVENSIHLPDVCTIRLHDAGFYWLDANTFKEGTPIEILAGFERSALTTLFWGEVTALEMDLAAHGVPTLLVRCMDRSHRLHRGRSARSFVQVKDSDIVQRIGQETGFQVKAEATAQVHDWVFQNNQTNWEFLTERAARNGFRLFIKGERELHFCKVKDEGDAVVEIQWGVQLRSFRPRTSAAPQVDEVVVRGWDPKQKRPIIGKGKAVSGVPSTRGGVKGAQAAHSAFGAAKMVIVDRPVHSQVEADDLARSLIDEIGGDYLQAEGLCFGDPKIRPGVQVEVPNIGKRFSGKYLVTATTHTYTPAEGYTTLFSVSGKHPNTVLALLGGSNGNGPGGARLGGNIVVGVVTDNKDPDGLGRVKIKYPWLSEEHTSFWARTVSQMAGKGRGMFNLPEIDDEVLVAFEHGEISRPYVIGQLWNGKDGLPGLKGNPTLGAGGEVNRRGFHTRIGHQLNFDDTGGKGDITLKTAGGHVVTLDDAGKKIEVTTTGGHKFVLDDAGKMIKATTTGGHMLSMMDPGAVITLKDIAGDIVTLSNGMVNVTALQMMTLAAPVINIAGAMAVNIAGLVTTMAAGTQATVSGGVGVLVKGGAKVDINAGAVINEKAPAINMNS